MKEILFGFVFLMGKWKWIWEAESDEVNSEFFILLELFNSFKNFLFLILYYYLNYFIFKKILNDEVLIYNQASLNIYGICLEKFKDSGVEFNEKNKIDNIINEINKNLNE